MLRKNMAKNKKPYSRVYVEITNICNKSCSFCKGTKRKPKMMGEEEFSLLLEKLSPLTDYLYFHLMGEPTVHPKLVRFIELARNAGYHPMITTNGTLLDSLGEKIIAAGVYKVNISLHSFENGSKTDAESYLKSCIDFAKRAEESGVIVTLRLWNGGTGVDNGIVIEELKQSFPCEWEENNRGARLSGRIFLEYADRFGWPDIEADALGADVYCHGLSDHFAILCDGSLVPCCLDSDGIMTLGNAFEEDISDILSAQRARNIKEGFRRRNTDEPLCQRCPYARRF